MLCEALFAVAQLIAFPVGDGKSGVFLRDAVSQILDQLQALGAVEFQQRREFLVHGRSIPTFHAVFNLDDDYLSGCTPSVPINCCR